MNTRRRNFAASHQNVNTSGMGSAAGEAVDDGGQPR